MNPNKTIQDTSFLVFFTSIQENLLPKTNTCRFLLLLKGQLSVAFQTKRFTFNEYDLFMIPPHMTCNVLGQHDNLVLLIEIDADFFSEDIEDLREVQCNSKLQALEHATADYNILRKTLVEIAKCVDQQEPHKNLLLTAYFYQLMYQLTLCIQEANSSESSNGETLEASKYAPRIKAIKRYIYQNYNKPITMNDLADQLYLTPQYMSKFIKQHLGFNFVDYLNSIRLKKAVEELTSTTNSITQIAFNHGFPNLTAFNKSFRAVYNETPMKYRNQLPTETSTKETSPEILPTISREETEEMKAKMAHILGNDQHTTSLSPLTTMEYILADAATAVPFKSNSFELINIGFATNILSHDFQAQLAHMQADLNFKYARFQGIIEPEIIDKIPNSNAYNFSKANRIIDYLYSINLLPFIEIGSKPRKVNASSKEFLFYSDNQSLFKSLDDWQFFLQCFFNNCINRYGIAEVEKWKFEIWLPHGKHLEYTAEGIASFMNHYKIIHNVLKTALPSAQLGGFGYNISSNENFLEDVLNQLEDLSMPLDFLTIITFHLEIPKKNDANLPYFTTKKDYLSHKLVALSKLLSKRNLPIIVAEWNFDYTSRNYMNDSIFKALFVVKNILENTHDVQSIGYWLLSDITSEYKDTNKMLFGGNGLLSIDGLKKPAYFAYQFLSMLGKNVIKKGKGYVITKSSRDTYQILLYNYVHPSDFFCLKYDTEITIYNVNDIFEEGAPKDMSIEIANISRGNYRVKTYVLNKDSGSILDEWIKMGAIQSITPIEINYFNSITVPSQSVYYAMDVDVLKLTHHLEVNEMHFLTIQLEI